MQKLQETSLKPFPEAGSGALRALAELPDGPIFPAVAVETRLRWVGLTQADFDWVTTYENSRRSKPSPAYYRDILERMGKRFRRLGPEPSEPWQSCQTGLQLPEGAAGIAVYSWI